MRPTGAPPPFEGVRQGLWHRRAAVALHTFGLMTRLRWVRWILFFHFLLGVAQAGVILLLGKLASPSSFPAINEFLKQLNFQWHLIGQTLFKWISENPDVAVGASQNVTLYFLSIHTTLPGTLLILGLSLPHLICRDSATSALTIYLSKALGPRDYLLGKAGAVLGLLGLSWVLPTVGAWLLGNLLSGEPRFLLYSLGALAHTLVFMGISCLFLTALALGVSSLGSRDSLVITPYFILWGALSAVATSFRESGNVLRHISFSQNLRVLARGLFDLNADLELVVKRLHIPESMTRDLQVGDPELGAPLLVLGIMAGLGIYFSHRAVRRS